MKLSLHCKVATEVELLDELGVDCGVETRGLLGCHSVEDLNEDDRHRGLTVANRLWYRSECEIKFPSAVTAVSTRSSNCLRTSVEGTLVWFRGSRKP